MRTVSTHLLAGLYRKSHLFTACAKIPYAHTFHEVFNRYHLSFSIHLERSSARVARVFAHLHTSKQAGFNSLV